MQKQCRFNFSRPPMPFTILVQAYKNRVTDNPEEDGLLADQYEEDRKVWNRIYDKLEDENQYNEGKKNHIENLYFQYKNDIGSMHIPSFHRCFMIRP